MGADPRLPTLLTTPTRACPRCDSNRVLAIAAVVDNAFDWRECEECAYLWAIPRGWTAHEDFRRGMRK